MGNEGMRQDINQRDDMNMQMSEIQMKMQTQRNELYIKRSEFETERSSICQTNTLNVCLSQTNCEEWFISCMIALFVGMLLITISAIVLLLKQRHAYPIAERSYLLSIQICICFALLTCYYPLQYISIYYDEQIYPFFKFMYMIGLFGLYLTYFSRSFRIYAAFHDRVSDYFKYSDSHHYSSQITRRQSLSVGANPQSLAMKILISIIKTEWLIALIIVIVSLLLCIPLFFNPDFYLIPIQDYDKLTSNQISGLDEDLKGDFATSFVYQFTVAFFILQMYILRNVPKHYRFHQESWWNLSTQWAKASILFIFNYATYDDHNWCASGSTVNIFANYIQYISMMCVSIIPALWRSQYISAPPPFPQLKDFLEFIEDEGDDNNIFCNRSFICFLNQRDNEYSQTCSQMNREIQPHQFRYNLNIYDFYFEVKTILLIDDERDKLNEFIRVANFYIFNPKERKFLLEFPMQFANSISQVRQKYEKFNELKQEQQEIDGQDENLVFQLKDQDVLYKNEFMLDIEKVHNQCSKFLREKLYNQYTTTNAFQHIKLYYDKQNSYQTNLKQLNLLHHFQ